MISILSAQTESILSDCKSSSTPCRVLFAFWKPCQWLGTVVAETFFTDLFRDHRRPVIQLRRIQRIEKSAEVKTIIRNLGLAFEQSCWRRLAALIHLPCTLLVYRQTAERMYCFTFSSKGVNERKVSSKDQLYYQRNWCKLFSRSFCEKILSPPTIPPDLIGH